MVFDPVVLYYKPQDLIKNKRKNIQVIIAMKTRESPKTLRTHRMSIRPYFKWMTTNEIKKRITNVQSTPELHFILLKQKGRKLWTTSYALYRYNIDSFIHNSLRIYQQALLYLSSYCKINVKKKSYYILIFSDM